MISVIVPAYNAEDYLEEAILSVFSQTFGDWELILVDDGSTDSTPLLCDRAAGKSGKVRVVHKANGGLSSARNAGIEIAAGSHITFLDADDILPPDSLAIMMKAARLTGADIVCGDALLFNDSSPTPAISGGCRDVAADMLREFSPHDAIKETLYQRHFDNSAWGKLYSSTIWDTVRFRENILYEDLDVFYRAFEIANKIVKVNCHIYLYRQHGGSILHNFNFKRADVLTVAERIADYAGSHGEAMLKAAHSRQLSANFNIMGLIAANGLTRDNAGSEIADRCWQKIKELRGESLRNPNVRLKNKAGIIVSYLFGRKGVEKLSSIVYRD